MDVNAYRYHQLHVPNYIEDRSLEVFNWNENEDDIITNEYEAAVYNFEMEDHHTYFVSKLGIWVHQ